MYTKALKYLVKEYMILFFKAIFHIFIISILTIVTQIGGLIWLLTILFCQLFLKYRPRWVKLGVFFTFYFLISFSIVPKLAKLNGRTPLPIFNEDGLGPHNIITPLLNRHYVKPELKENLLISASHFQKNNQGIKLSYLDANFPFIDGFPLLPHISHNDGLKVDLCFMYKSDGELTNDKPSRSGYGVFVEPSKNEYNQSIECKKRGFWQYDFTKFITLGSHKNLDFDAEATRQLMQLLLSHRNTDKILIEPHLKTRMNLNHSKIRFQGCHSVRHDDHIHYQIKP